MLRASYRSGFRVYSSSAPLNNVSVEYKKHFINNQFVDSLDSSTFSNINPSTGDVICDVANGKKADIDRAVSAAKKAFDRKSEWRQIDATSRGKLLSRLGELVERDAKQLASLESIDNGKPYGDAMAADVFLTTEHYKYYGGYADKIMGNVIPADGNISCYTRKEPIGVVGCIIPWNFPMLMQAWKLGPALAAGNTVVMKTAEQTPLSALHIAKLSKEAGFPDGVLNIVNGDGINAGAPLVDHPDVGKIAFTGSTEVGKIIGSKAGAAIKPCTLELGGKSPLIVTENADINDATTWADLGLFFNMGQCCTAASRIFVHESKYDQVVDLLVKFAKKRKCGDPFDKDTSQGPLVDESQFKKVLSFIESGKNEGAKLCIGGKRHGDRGYFVRPTIFADVTDSMKIAREEIFGPVMQILKYKNEDEVIDRANNTSFGLAAAIMSNDINQIHRMSEVIEAGTVWINCHNVFATQAPFGGYKESGIGREKGFAAIDSYTQLKTVITNIKR
ncbi:hypothetical protein SNEBB_009310 [Seison nebaliae]|nr:hypothetical protein SNEBB_009310 [Seison nebaliae]